MTTKKKKENSQAGVSPRKTSGGGAIRSGIRAGKKVAHRNKKLYGLIEQNPAAQKEAHHINKTRAEAAQAAGPKTKPRGRSL